MTSEEAKIKAAELFNTDGSEVWSSDDYGKGYAGFDELADLIQAFSDAAKKAVDGTPECLSQFILKDPVDSLLEEAVSEVIGYPSPVRSKRLRDALIKRVMRS